MFITVHDLVLSVRNRVCLGTQTLALTSSLEITLEDWVNFAHYGVLLAAFLGNLYELVC
jgi:hypothetical protein